MLVLTLGQTSQHDHTLYAHCITVRIIIEYVEQLAHYPLIDETNLLSFVTDHAVLDSSVKVTGIIVL